MVFGLITRIIIFHEGGIPVYSWPEEGESVAIMSSFFSAIRQFSQAHFSQDIAMIGLERDNIVFLRHGNYVLALVFSDRAETPLIERMSRRILGELSPLLEKDIDELQLEGSIIAEGFRRALDRSGFFWLYEVASNVIRHENVMGMSIFEVVDMRSIEPLYYPLEPYLGFERILRAAAGFVRIVETLKDAGMLLTKITLLAQNGNGVQSWFFENLVAILEYAFGKHIGELTQRVLSALGRMESERSPAITGGSLVEPIFALSIDVLGDVPTLCQFVTEDKSIIFDFSDKTTKVYQAAPHLDIVSYRQ